MSNDLLARHIDKSFESVLNQSFEKQKQIKDELTLLRDYFTPIPISGVTYKIINGRKVGYRQVGVWDEKRGGGYDITYEHTETYAGTTTTLNLDFVTQVMLKRIELVWDDDTARTYEIRVFSDKDNSVLYSVIRGETANIKTSAIISLDFVYPAGSRLQFYFSSYTATKLNKILVAIEEL